MKHPFLVTRACIDSTRIGEEMAVYMNHFTLSILPPLYFFILHGVQERIV